MRPSRIATGSPMLERKHGDGVITPRRSNVAALDGSISARAHRVTRLEDEEQIPASPLAHRPSLVRFNSHRGRKSVDSTNNPPLPPEDDDSPPPMGESIVGSYSDGYNQLQMDTEALERQMERHRQSLLNSTPRGSKADREAAEEEFVAAAALAAIQKQLQDQPNLSYEFDEFSMESSPLDEEKGDSEMRRKKPASSSSSSSSVAASHTKRPSSSVAPLSILTSPAASTNLSVSPQRSPRASPRASPRNSPPRSSVTTPTAQLSTPVRSPQPRHSPVSPSMNSTGERLSFLQLNEDTRSSPKRGSPQRKESPPIRKTSPPVTGGPLPTGLEILASRHDHVGITHAQDDSANASFEFAFDDDDDEKVDRESNDRPVKTVVAEPVRRSSPAPALALAPTQTPRASTVNATTTATPKSATAVTTPSSARGSSNALGFPVRPSGAISLDEMVPSLSRPSSTPTPTARTLSNPSTPNKLRAALANPITTSNSSSANNSAGVSPITSPTSSTPSTPNKPLLRTVSVSSNAASIASATATPTASSSRATGAGATGASHLAVPSPSASTTPHGSTPPSPRSPRSPASPNSDRYSSTFAQMENQAPAFPSRSASMITTGSHHSHNASHPSPNPNHGSQTPSGHGDRHHHSASVIIPLHSPPGQPGQSSTPMRKKRGQIFFPEGSELVRHDQLPPNKNRLHNRNGIKPILRLSSMVSDLPPAQEVFSYLPYFGSQHRAVLPPLMTYAKEHLNDFHGKLAMDAQFIRTTQCGASLVKYNSSGKPQRRWFFVEETESEWRLIWENVKSNTEENHNGLPAGSNHSPAGLESPSSSTPSSPPNGLTSPSTPNKEKSKPSSSSNILPFFQIGKWKFNQERARSLIDVTGLHYGPYYSANFCSFLDQSNAVTSPASGNDNNVNKPWLCFSVQFKDRTIDLLCNNENQVTQWFLGLQALAPLSVFHMRRSQLAWQRVVMKLNHYGVAWLRESMFKIHLDHHLLQVQQTKSQAKKKAVFGAKQLRKASDRLAMSDAM